MATLNSNGSFTTSVRIDNSRRNDLDTTINSSSSYNSLSKTYMVTLNSEDDAKIHAISKEIFAKLQGDLSSYSERIDNFMKKIVDGIDQSYGPYKQLSEMGAFIQKFNEVSQIAEEQKIVIDSLKDIIVQQAEVISKLKSAYEILNSDQLDFLSTIATVSQIEDQMPNLVQETYRSRTFFDALEREIGVPVTSYQIFRDMARKMNPMNYDAEGVAQGLIQTPAMNSMLSATVSKAIYTATELAKRDTSQQIVEFSDMLQAIGVITPDMVSDSSSEDEESN